jgi:hypothetical protein
MPTRSTPSAAAPRLLAGGNPQIPKGEGDAPVQAYIAAMPGWKRAVGERLDALISAAVPTIRPGCSTRAWTATRAARSTCTRATRSTRRH